MNRILPTAALLLACAAPTLAQVPFPPVPGRAASPLLYVRFNGPVGSRLTFYQGEAPGREYPAPATVGLRPGYLYRVKLTGLPGNPDATVFPTVEVRGTLSLPPTLNPARYPAPAVVNEVDLAQVAAGSLVTKVVYLEHPEKAASADVADQGLETNVTPGGDALEEARALGRPILILRLGARRFEAAELKAQSVPGTILFPGEKALSAPLQPPCLPWSCLRYYDPTLGPRPPEEECLHDGGDQGIPAGFDNLGKLHGLDPSDTIAEYRDERGTKRLTPSNRVCLCVPRFGAIRVETPLAATQVTVSPVGELGVTGQALLEGNQPSLATRQAERMAAFKGRRRANATLAIEGVDRLIKIQILNAREIYVGPALLVGTNAARELTEIERTRLLRQMEFARTLTRRLALREVAGEEGTAVVGRVKGLELIRGVVETRECEAACGEAPLPPGKPLCVYKWADRQEAQIGDVVTFTIKYSNQGGQPITDVAVSDSLTGRLEYVAGTAESSRDAVFTTEANEAGSLILRWEVAGVLQPGQGGVVRFQARIR